MNKKRAEDLDKLQKVLSCEFKETGLLDTALTHSSYVNESRDDKCSDNERLEFLGDAVLQLCISDLLVRKFPEYREGQLSKLRSSLVGEKSLAKIAKKFRIGRFLLLGRGEDASGGRKKSSILENAVEAVIAAVYKDAGYEKTFSFIEEIFGPFIEEQAGGIAHRDYKSLLQELSQSRFKAIPKYRLVGQSGPDHDKTFLVNMSLKDIFSTEGTGKNKKEAEQEAARKAIEELESPEGGKP